MTDMTDQPEVKPIDVTEWTYDPTCPCCQRNPPHSGNHDTCPDCKRAKPTNIPEIGPIEASTRADIERMGDLKGGTRATLAQLALFQSRSLDRLATSDVDPAKLSALSKVFLSTLAELKKNEADDEEMAEFRKWVRAQMGHAEDPWKGQFRGEAGPDQLGVSPAVDAVAEIRGGRVDGNRPGD